MTAWLFTCGSTLVYYFLESSIDRPIHPATILNLLSHPASTLIFLRPDSSPYIKKNEPPTKRIPLVTGAGCNLYECANAMFAVTRDSILDQ